MLSEEDLNFSRSGIARIYEKIQAGEMSDEDFRRAAENTQRILSEGGVDVKVRYMGTLESKLAELKGIEALQEFITLVGPDWHRFRMQPPKPQQTRLFEEK